MEAVLDLRRHAAGAPDRCAVVCGDERLTYGELEAMANRLAHLLRARGLQRGDHLAGWIGNRPEALALAWAAWRTGIYLTLVSNALAAVEVRYLVEDCDAKAVIVDAALASIAAQVAWPTALLRLSLRGVIAAFEDLAAALDAASPAPAEHEPPGALMMTASGTTGAPKGVHRPLLPADWRGTPPFAADLIDLFGVGGVANASIDAGQRRPCASLGALEARIRAAMPMARRRRCRIEP